ncbi:hypothetical protein EMCG_02736 [[Emmonsia] crescens]|uniref:Uncharacterized protein n=1 Tax=[Emmonsia] crescens TaxID=73230 RepID=A0A0G2J8V5_9EURO|nr:hypothetical protein EMCG_02736 [Emmonsia crescens UAMH 3008]
MDIIVICNSKGNPEIIVQPERDANNMTRTKEKCPRHPIQEDIESLPPYLNPILEPLMLCLARGMFRDFDTVDERFALEPQANECFKLALCLLRVPMYDSKTTCNPSVMESSLKERPGPNSPANNLDTGTPLFEAMLDKGPAGSMLNATWLDTELKKLGHRSGYGMSISIHDIHAEAMVRADGERTVFSNLNRYETENGYSLDGRMKFSGHRNPREFYDSYMPATSSVSGVSNILKLKP